MQNYLQANPHSLGQFARSLTRSLDDITCCSDCYVHASCSSRPIIRSASLCHFVQRYETTGGTKLPRVVAAYIRRSTDRGTLLPSATGLQAVMTRCSIKRLSASVAPIGLLVGYLWAHRNKDGWSRFRVVVTSSCFRGRFFEE